MMNVLVLLSDNPWDFLFHPFGTIGYDIALADASGNTNF